MTAGPNSETYFEHSFFARQWDFPLVGGADLTVRDQRVYLKTLAGLNPVDVILRRLDDDFCDPLELRGDSLLGVPGLVQAARAGNVYIANCLGSGLVEAPALMAFLPALCRQVLGEELLMPSVATWWCGQESARRQVMERFDRVVIKPAFPRFGQHAEFPATMTEAERGSAGRPRRGAARPVRGPGAGGPLDDARAHASRPRAQARRAAGDRGVGRLLLCGDAWRPDPRRHGPAVAGRVDAARRRQQGHVGARPRLRASRPRREAAGASRHVRHVHRAVEPHGRQPVLAGAIRRAAGGERTPDPGAAAGAVGRIRSRQGRVGGHRGALPARPGPAAAGVPPRLGAPLVEPGEAAHRHGARRQGRGQHRLEPGAAAPPQLGGEGTAVARHVARAAADRGSLRRRGADQPRPPRAWRRWPSWTTW